jgi:hypothetical protein
MTDEIDQEILDHERAAAVERMADDAICELDDARASEAERCESNIARQMADLERESSAGVDGCELRRTPDAATPGANQQRGNSL